MGVRPGCAAVSDRVHRDTRSDSGETPCGHGSHRGRAHDIRIPSLHRPKVPGRNSAARRNRRNHRILMTPYGELCGLKISDRVRLGAQILMAAIRLDEMVCRGDSPASALKSMSECRGIYNPRLTAAMESPESGTVVADLPAAAAHSKVSVQ